MREKDKERDKSKKNTDEKIEIMKEKDFIISALAAVVSVTFFYYKRREDSKSDEYCY